MPENGQREDSLALRLKQKLQKGGKGDGRNEK
jgi:hypothetical protein